MKAGILKEVIEVWRKVELENDYGEKSYEYKKVKSIRAEVANNGGSRVIENAGEIFHDYNKKLYVRIYQDVRDEDNIKYDGKFYRVVFVETDRTWQRKIITMELIND